MKKILYDNQIFTFSHYGGAARYFSDLIHNLPQSEFVPELPMHYSENHYITETYGHIYKKISFPCSKWFRNRIYSSVNRRLSQNAIKNNDYEIFHPTGFNHYFLNHIKERKIPFVLTVHNIAFEHYPQDKLIYDHNTPDRKRLIAEADHIITASENTKNEIIGLLGILPSKITVIHNGYRPVSVSAKKLFDRYVLYVGERNGYKNFYPWLSAIRQIFNFDPDLKIVCTGAPFSPSEAKLLARWNVANRIIHIPATDAQLASLYRHALCLVLPSHYEGFGMPIIEAFANGCPVCTSNSSSLPEVAGDAAIYFNPYDSQSMLDAFKEILVSSTLREELKERGAIRSKDFSLERMVEQTCNVYKKM